MRKVIAEIAISVDGYIEGPAGELDWLVFDEEIPFLSQFLSRFEVIFYGRKTYERLGVHLLNNMRKYVFSRTLRHVDGNAMVVNENIEETIRQIKEEEGKDIWLCGGAGMINTLARLDLIDEYLLAVQPVVLGSGKSLFGDLDKRIELRLMEAERLNSGVVILNYKPV
jgi:dihydrofolate reductase